MSEIIANSKRIEAKHGQSFEDILEANFPNLKYVTNVVCDGVRQR